MNIHIKDTGEERDNTLRYFPPLLYRSVYNGIWVIYDQWPRSGGRFAAGALKGSLFLKYLCVPRRKRKYCTVFDIAGGSRRDIYTSWWCNT